MSLKAFHLLFITLSTLLALGFGAWGVEAYISEESVPRLAMGVLSLVAACALIVYGVWARQKLKDLGEP